MKTNGKSGFALFESLAKSVLAVAVAVAILGCIISLTRSKKPVGGREKASPQQFKVENSAYLKIGTKLDEQGVKFTLERIAEFETNHPNVRITEQQVIWNWDGGCYVIQGVFLRHEPRTNVVGKFD